MYPISNDTKALFDAEQRQVLRITGTDRNGNVVSITESDVMMGGFSIDRTCVNGNRIEIGTAISSEMTLRLDNRQGKFNDIEFDGTELFVEIGIADWTQSNPTVSYIPCGYFTPDEQPRSLNTITLHALDRMIDFDKKVENLTLPNTIASIVGQACTACSVPFTQSLSGFPNYNYLVSELPDLQQAISYRDLIQWCAGIMGTNAYVDWTGSLCFAWYDNATGYSSTTASRYKSDLYESAIVITGVSFTDPDSDNNTVYLAGTDVYTLDLSGNALINAGNASSILQAVYTKVHDFAYTPFSASVIAAPYLWPMDRMTFTDKNGVGHVSSLTNVNFGVNGTTAIASIGETTQYIQGLKPNPFTDRQLNVLRNIQHVTSTAISDAVDDATAQITGASGGNVRFIYDNSGNMTEIVIMDTDSITTATKVWRWNSGGLGYSSNGYAGPYALAMTQNGAIVADFITAGEMSADRISGGTIDGTTVNAKLLNIVNALGTVVASFGNSITLGKTNDMHLTLDYNSLELVPENPSYGNGFSIGDLRDENKQATLTENATGDGVKKSFVLNASYITISIKINGTEVPDTDYFQPYPGVNAVEFYTAPAAGADIEFTYITTTPVYYFDFGIRVANSTIGNRSFICGQRLIASEFCTHAEGYGTTASGISSHAEGSETTASGGYSHAEGSGTTASGSSSHAEGYETTASGSSSHAEGRGTIARGASSHAKGRYNIEDSNNTYAEIVGNGSADNNRANARTLSWYGNEWLAGTLTQGSDARHKNECGEVPDVFGIKARRFTWNDQKPNHDSLEHIGYYAQDVEATCPYLVSEDASGYKSLDYIGFLCAKINSLERRVGELTKDSGASAE